MYSDRAEEIHLVSDIAANVRPRPQVRIWQVQRILGHGGYAAVRLEKRRDNGEVRAMKLIEKDSTCLSTNDYEKS